MAEVDEGGTLIPRDTGDTAVPFGSALAGGAIAGLPGAVMALPVAVLITAIVRNTGRTYDVVYQSANDSDDQPDALPTPADTGGEGAPADAHPATR